MDSKIQNMEKNLSCCTNYLKHYKDLYLGQAEVQKWNKASSGEQLSLHKNCLFQLQESQLLEKLEKLEQI